ncbi:unnamed protein product [Diatraea saccharalis]|uniref:Uncharacterized protein n=1 Tax=Diatraea saccharalis TaxID=40085 RepID=A0A9N9QUI2_9NEOP|nr:unnamed protein product [Diatraea saccharalis]
MDFGTINTFHCNTNSSTVFGKGCSTAFGSFVQSHMGSIGLAGVFLIILQAFAVGGAIWLAKMTRDEQGAYP